MDDWYGLMILNDYKQIMLNLIWGIIGGGLSYIVNFLITPYITYNVGIEAYGFVSLGNTLVTYINIIAISLNSFAARFVAVHFHRGEYESANTIYSSVMIGNFIFSIFTMIICLPIIYKINIFLYVPSNILSDVKILFLLILFNYIINLFVGVISISAFITNRTRITTRSRSMAAIVYALLILVLFAIFGASISYIGIANLLATTSCVIFIYKASQEIENNLYFRIKLFSWKSVRKIIQSGIFNSINSLGGTLGSGLDLLITNKFLNNVIMGQIAVGNQLSTVATMGLALLSGVFQPKQLEAFSKGNINDLITQLKFSMKICGFFGLSFLVQFINFGKVFLSLWIPEQDTNTIFFITVIILIGVALVSIVMPLYYVPTLTLNMQLVCLVTVVCGVVNVISMLFLIHRYPALGPYVVVGTTTFLNLVALILFPYLSKLYLKLNYNPFWNIIAKFSFLIMAFLIINYFAGGIQGIVNWGGLLCYGTLVEVLIFLVYMPAMFSISELHNVVKFVFFKFKMRI